MQTLVDAHLVMEAQDTYFLQYVLMRPGMLSTTGYKVLQSQEAAGLIPCYRVVYDTMDKLDYDVERYQNLASLLSSLEANVFLNYVKGVLSIILNMRNIGFLHPYNLETTLDKIYIDTKDSSVHMVYLPIAETYQAQMNAQYVRMLKASLGKAIQDNNNLQSNITKPLFDLLADGVATLETLLAALAELPPLPHQVDMPATGTIALNPTGEIGNSGGLSSRNLGQPASVQDISPAQSNPVSEQIPESTPVKGKQKPQKKKLFAKKATVPMPEEIQDTGGTEVLSLFVPSIYLKGQGKSEFLVDKQEFFLGRDGAADGAIDSTAISRRHCKITHSDGRNFVTDLTSANGTYLNGAKLEPDKPRPVNEGDKLKLGNIGFTVMNV